MNKLKKINAFTLAELLVVLAITTLVVSLAFAVISIFQRNYTAIERNYQVTTSRQLLEQKLTVDFNSFRKISYTPFENVLFFRNAIDSVSYRFENDLMLQDFDTVLSKITAKKLYFKGEEVNSGKVDALKLIFDDEETETLFFYALNDLAQEIHGN